jgi:hypothetical protein
MHCARGDPNNDLLFYNYLSICSVIFLRCLSKKERQFNDTLNKLYEEHKQKTHFITTDLCDDIQKDADYDNMEM